jgi:hypothetical protein
MTKASRACRILASPRAVWPFYAFPKRFFSVLRPPFGLLRGCWRGLLSARGGADIDPRKHSAAGGWGGCVMWAGRTMSVYIARRGLSARKKREKGVVGAVSAKFPRSENASSRKVAKSEKKERASRMDRSPLVFRGWQAKAVAASREHPGMPEIRFALFPFQDGASVVCCFR